MSAAKIGFWRTLKEYALISLGLMLFVIGWTIFLVPNNLVGGGVTGIASIVQYATGIKMGYTYFVVNLLLLAAGVLVLGKGFGFKTVYAVLFTSVCLNVFQGIVPQELIEGLALANGKLMCTIIGGIMVGIGIGMSFSQGGSTGGTDIIALMVIKYRNISPGKVILLMDFIIISSSILVPSYAPDGSVVPFAEKFTTVIYGLILVTVNSYVIDLYLSGSKQSVQVFILSRRYAEIADAVTMDLHRGVTVLDGKGWYTKKESEILMVVTRKTDLNILLRTIKSIDPEAFLSVSTVAGVYGQGFDTLKGSSTRPEDKKEGKEN